MTVNVIARTDEHFRNWINEQGVNPRIVIRIYNFRDASYIVKGEAFVSLTPMVDAREEERIRALLKSRQCTELSHKISEWPLTEFV